MKRSATIPTSLAPKAPAAHGLALVVALLGAAAPNAGCIGTVLLDDGDSSTSEPGTTTSLIATDGLTVTTSSSEGTATTDVGDSTDGPSGVTTSSSESTATTGVGDSTGGPSYACPPAAGEQQCDLIAQDCPADLHCIPFDTTGNYDFDATACVPSIDDPSPRFEACTADDASCEDSCEAGAYCFPGLVGPLCLGTCDADGDDAACGGGERCLTCESCAFGTCVPTCDPLEPACPELFPTCGYREDIEGTWHCSDLVFQGYEAGEPCEYSLSCAQGLACAPAETVDGCGNEAMGCCTPLCDLDLGDSDCAAPHVCAPFYPDGTAPAGLEDLGVCELP